MKIKELVKKLSSFNPELDIVIECEDGYCYDISDFVTEGYCSASGDKFSEDVDPKNINVVKIETN